MRKSTVSMARALLIIVVCMLTLMCVGALAQVSETPDEAVAVGIQRGTLPEWVDSAVDQRYRLRLSRVYACLSNPGTGDRWVTWTSWVNYLEFRLSGKWNHLPKVPWTQEDWDVCGWEMPEEPSVPRAIGAPAYWSIACVVTCDSGLVDWNRMRVAGATIPGEICGELVDGPPAGWYMLPRLRSAGGVIAVAQCE